MSAVLSAVSHLIWPAIAILSVVSHSIWPAMASLSVRLMQRGPLLVLELVGDRRAEGGELRDGERRRHAEMGDGGLAEVGNL